MRGLLLALFVFGSTPWMLRLPFVGLLFWMWFGFMNPHRLTFGWAYGFPWVQWVGAATILGWLASREPRRIPMTGTTTLWILFTLWCSFTTIFALNPEYAWPEWERFIKVQVMILFMLFMLVNRRRIDLAVIVIAASIGFYGVKGGIFTILGGGQYMVWGPAKSFISGNTEIGFAMVVTAPLIWYLRSVATHRWVRLGCMAAFGLCLISILGSYSRGAFLALGAMVFFLWLRSRGKVVTAVAAIVALGIGLSLMPAQWFDRMATIQNYEQDQSAMGRINAWTFAFNLANDHPIAGGGFGAFTPQLFQRYAPDPEKFHDAHSIVFEVLGEQGYIGLLLFLGLGLATFVRAIRVERLAKGREDLAWAASLARMCQVALVGYLVGGAFLGLAYFDLPYTVMAIVVATGAVVQKRLAGNAVETGGGWREAIAPPPPPPPTPLRQPVAGGR
jgi:probable O-glycosylation ligase (exosortase A-associated)